MKTILPFNETNLRSTSRALRTPTRVSRTFLLPICIALCGTLRAATQDWTLVDEVARANAYGVVSDSVGNIYVAGSISDPEGLNGALILKSSDQGQTWDADPSTPGQDPSLYLATEAGMSFQALASAHIQIAPALFQDHVVALGASTAGRTVYRSVDAGAAGSWIQIAGPASFPTPGYSQPALRSISIDSLGNIYVAGSAVKTIVTTSKGKPTTSTEGRWVVYKGSRSVSETGVESYSWGAAPVDDFLGSATGVACAGSVVFVAGSNGNSWHVRKSSDGGATWEDVDHFQMESGSSAQPYAITTDQFGRVIVSGLGTRKGGKATSGNYWVVRGGTGSGSQSFKTLDSFEGLNPNARAVTVALDGSVYASGWVSGSLGVRVWTTRKGNEVDGVWSWSTDDAFYFAANQYADCFGAAASPSGKVFAIGTAAGHSSWIVRAKLGPSVP